MLSKRQSNMLPYYICSFLLIGLSYGQILQQFTQNPCASKSSCHECIQTPSCAWCYDPDINTTKRCYQPSHALPPLDSCNPDLIHNPDNIMIPIQSIPLSRSRAYGAGGAEGTLVSGYEGEVSSSGFSGAYGSTSYEGGSSSGGGYSGSAGHTQVSPQKLKLKLRANQVYSISMGYTQAEDYPVDLYYLMDLSKSMEDDKEKLSALGDHLAQTMKNITSKFTLGFGSFVDKVVMPYVSTIPENLISPCPGCQAPYGFRNVMPLSKNTWQFSQMVTNATVSGNLDAPEGGFDAIMQAIVCRDQIRWRDQARKLLVFSTDADFHYAGDGKLGGIVKPNDGECHLDSRGYYTKSSEQDYPSISQINAYIKKNAINIIFAVTQQKIDIYRQLQQHVEGSSCAQLSNDSSNIVELIKEQYEQISSTVEMKHNASSAINIRFFSKCLNSEGKIIETNKCGNIKVGSIVEFRVEMEVVKCPINRKEWNQIVQIYPVGINESLTIDLEMLCDCPCERPDSLYFNRNAPICNHQGTYMCGICDCDPGAYGPFCKCFKNETADNVTIANCINPKNGLECSGRGTCICGKCECEPRNTPEETVYGDTCDCDNFSCERHNGKICSGPENGYCDCGQCKCLPGWTGDNCACRDTIDSCIAPDPNSMNNNVICSGNGVCECGVCKCNVTEDGKYFGKFCEHCPTCTEDDCHKYKDCVQCQQYKTGPLSKKGREEECSECGFTPIAEETVEVNEKNNEILCAFYDEDDCRFAFVYYFNDNKTIAIRAQKERKCPAKVFLLGVVLGVIGAVVLLGLAILLFWRLFTYIHDKREYAKFEKEKEKAKWHAGENPLYKQATSTFKNPTYAGKG